jgi:nitrogen regulatory protein P-II 2
MSEGTIHLMTIVAESVLEERLVRDVGECGAGGWTITPCRGVTMHEGHGGGAADIEGGNIRVDVLIHREGVEQVWSVLERDYFDSYAVVAWSAPVRVRRDEKFRAP